MIRTYLKLIHIYESTTIITVGNPVRCTWRNYKKARFGSQKELPNTFQICNSIFGKIHTKYQGWCLGAQEFLINEWQKNWYQSPTHYPISIQRYGMSISQKKIRNEYNNNNYYCIHFFFLIINTIRFYIHATTSW